MIGKRRRAELSKWAKENLITLHLDRDPWDKAYPYNAKDRHGRFLCVGRSRWHALARLRRKLETPMPGSIPLPTEDERS